MKTIQLTPRQRKEIGERRRQAQDRRIYQRLSAVLWIDEGRTREEVAALLGVTTRQVGECGSGPSATRGWSNSAPCTTRATPAASDRPRSSASGRRSPRGPS